MNSNAANFVPGNSGYANPYSDGHGSYGADQGYQQQTYATDNPYAMYDPIVAGGYANQGAVPGGAHNVYYDHHQAVQHFSGAHALTDPSTTGYGLWSSGGEVQIPPHRQAQDLAALENSTEPGSYYPLPPFSPQWGAAPVTAVAYDETYDAMYVASATQSNGRPSVPSRYNSQSHHPNYDRSAMLSIHSTNPTDNGMLYASVAGHPEASRDALTAVYASMYGFSAKASTERRTAVSHAPPHAYKPVYGRTNASTPGMDLATAMIGGAFSVGKNTFHMGINTLLPTAGHVASISPSAVRIHAHGGLQLADQPMEGMICGTVHPHHQHPSQHNGGTMFSHITAGGVTSGTHQRHQLHCFDVWQGLQVAASRTLRDSDHNSSVPLGVTAMATSHERGSIVAGCSDGKIRLFDASLREVAKIRGPGGSVNNIAVSGDGLLIASTGYGHSSFGNTSLYAFPDPNVLVFDIRFLGRGGIAHPFSGLNGGPRFVSFIPRISDDWPANRLLVASGQTGGGMQIIVPFEPSYNDDPANFMPPQLDRGESISTMVISEDDLALGTSQSRVLQYKMAGYKRGKTQSSGRNVTANEFVPSSGSSNRVLTAQHGKQPLEMPSSVPALPALSLDPSLLQTDNPNVRNGINDRMKSIFATYTLLKDPTVSVLSPAANPSFGPLSEDVLITSKRRNVSSGLIAQADADDGDYLMTIPTKALNIQLMDNHADKKYNRRRESTRNEPLPNPNKTIYAQKISALCYETGVFQPHKPADSSSDYAEDNIPEDIPTRYRLTVRPNFQSVATFDHAEFNNTGLVPGWDYPPTMPNAFVSPVLLLLYFNPSLRSVTFSSQYNERLLFPEQSSETSLVPELGFLFHQIESLSRFAYSYFRKTACQRARVKPWVPSHFQASLASMPEAVQLQILDGSPAAVDLPRRVEAFYLFLLYQLDKEFGKIGKEKLLDWMHGTDFVTVNEFVAGSGETDPTVARTLTVELSYENFKNDKPPNVRFGQVLQRSLCGETRLRAWNQKSRSYETIIQRKIATSLPQTLCLSCGCAGRKVEDGLKFWRSTANTEDHWLPEIIEIELEDTGGVVVKQTNARNGNEYEWDSSRESSVIPQSVAALVAEKRRDATKKKGRYQLDAVISFVRDDLESGLSNPPPEASGHHVVHLRVSKAYRKLLLSEQHREMESLADDTSVLVGENNRWNPEVFKRRAEAIKNSLEAMDNEGAHDQWILANGYVVSDTVIEDARAFHVSFKEPCLVVYRAADEQDSFCQRLAPFYELSPVISVETMKTKSISNGQPPIYPVDIDSLPGKGDLVAFDAEFVSVQEEESTVTKTGSKVTLREVRHAVARISVIDCRSRRVLIDDHVLPKEPVVDYLTRFSGIVAKDLDPKQSPRHLISTRSAYLKLRFLMERGCIFVGHGLSQDFLIVNLVVPNRQIIDTVEIFHRPRMRYISLRFLTNYILKRDMQQDTHDSLEDALAAYELYLKACEWKKEGKFDEVLNGLYEYGRRTDWKLGVDAK